MKALTFVEAFTRAQSAPSRRYLTYWQTRCDRELTRVYRAAFPRRKLPADHDGQPNARFLPRLKAELAPGYVDAYARYQVLAEKIVARRRRAWKGWQARLVALAEHTPIEPGESRVVWEHWASMWSTQGYGAEHYARGAAEGDADKGTSWAGGLATCDIFCSAWFRTIKKVAGKIIRIATIPPSM